MKPILAKIKAFIDLLPVPFIRTAIVLVLGYAILELSALTLGSFSLISHGLAFLAGAFLWDGLKAKLEALRGWLGW